MCRFRADPHNVIGWRMSVIGCSAMKYRSTFGNLTVRSNALERVRF